MDDSSCPNCGQKDGRRLAFEYPMEPTEQMPNGGVVGVWCCSRCIDTAKQNIVERLVNYLTVRERNAAQTTE